MSANITKQALADVLKNLMDNEPLAKISVGDIVNQCGLNRNSFYYHFQDKYDLVNWIFYTEIAVTVQYDESMPGAPWSMIEAISQYLYDNKRFYNNALSVSGQNSFAEYFIGLLQKAVQARLLEAEPEVEHQEFYVSFFAEGIATAIFRWLQDGAKYTPPQFIALIRNAAVGAATRLLELEAQPKSAEED